MILLIHKIGGRIVEVRKDGEPMSVSANPCITLWHLAEKFPEEKILWVENDLKEYLDPGLAEKRIFHERIMVSYAVNSKFLPESIGYVDQLPFININPEIKFPTWRMSSDVGGIKGKTLLSFKEEFKGIRNFDLLLNSIAKVGQQNGLFCYSDPGLLQLNKLPKTANARAEEAELFSFVHCHYKTIWVYVLFFCLIRYENRVPLTAFLKAFFDKRFFGKVIDIPEITQTAEVNDASIDVIIPTVGRSKYLQQVVKDLSRQSLLPKRVIIVEQNPAPDSTSELVQMLGQEWPFEISHIFTHEAGACRSRNKALKEVKSDWVFFADDDIRMNREVLENVIQEAVRLDVECLNLNCKQEGEKTVFKKIKQWGSFGSGTSLVKSHFALQHEFSEVFEHGYGEDADYGMKLRNSGCDIIYHPDLELLHLKAPVGGFRKKPVLEWEKENPQPKPSPTLMILGKRYYTSKQMKGFKISLYLKFFRKQKTKNPWTYLKNMEQRWKRSEYWSERLEREINYPKRPAIKRIQE